MTADEKLIAEAAIDRRNADTYAVIHQEVSKITGINIEQVARTLDHLSREGFLKQSATPAWNLAEGPRPPEYMTWAWYERGALWPKEREFAQHAFAGELHIETRPVQGRWEWEVFRVKRHETIARGTEDTLQKAKRAAEAASGLESIDWKDIG